MERVSDSDSLARPGPILRFSGFSFVQAGIRCSPTEGCSPGVGSANRDVPEVGTGPVMDTLTKSDRLPVTSIRSVEPLARELQMPEELPSAAVPMVISRYREGSDLKAEKGGTKKVKPKDLKKHVRRVQRKQTQQACNPEESPLKRLFGAATICSN